MLLLRMYVFVLSRLFLKRQQMHFRYMPKRDRLWQRFSTTQPRMECRHGDNPPPPRSSILLNGLSALLQATVNLVPSANVSWKIIPISNGVSNLKRTTNNKVCDDDKNLLAVGGSVGDKHGATSTQPLQEKAGTDIITSSDWKRCL